MTYGVVVTTEADISMIDKIDKTVEMEELETDLETAPLTIPNDALVNVLHYIPNIVVDLKYTTEDNFTGQQIYNSDMPAMLRYGTVKKLSGVQAKLNAVGYTLVIWDAYRPIDAQFKLWEVCPDSRYVANPNNGYSSHSRGDTVDVTIQTLIGEPVEMPTNFDDFSAFADRDYGDASLKAKDNAMMLEELMELHGFTPYSAEWWHFSDTDKYDVVPEGVG
jgi:D-alanyl-D-alanine dipeptidase